MKFGDFEPLCRNTPSYPWCNLFYRQLLNLSPDSLTGLSIPTESAPVGINPKCGMLRFNHGSSLPNVANIAACGVSFFLVILLGVLCNRRKAAVGRIELRTFLGLYALTLPFQLLTTASIFEQGSMALTVLTAIHAGLVAATFWTLLANAIVATQVVEDGTLSSLIPFTIGTILIFGGTLYISLDIGLQITDTVGGLSDPPESIRSIALFVLTSIWPAAAALFYLIIMSYIVLKVLNEYRPMYFYVGAAVLFILSQLAWFLLGRVLCTASDAKVDGSFLGTLLETASVFMLYLAWKSITEESWDDNEYYPS